MGKQKRKRQKRRKGTERPRPVVKDPMRYTRDALNTQDPPVRHQEPRLRERSMDDPRFFWPAGEKTPTGYRRRRLPCPNCRRVALDDLGQAVICRTIQNMIAYLRCRACGHHWCLPVEDE